MQNQTVPCETVQRIKERRTVSSFLLYIPRVHSAFPPLFSSIEKDFKVTSTSNMPYKTFHQCLGILLALIPLFSPALVSCDSNVPIVRTTSGRLRGFSPYPKVQAYLGIRYAVPPVGDLRFAPPEQNASNVSSIVDAIHFSPACYQVLFETPFADKLSGVAEAEDCLSINVLKPSESNGSLPVLAYLHGGAFVQGANSAPNMDGIRLVAEQNNMIYVGIK